ncbi:3'(2'),5'-bisphosphate nucleotidase CysQ [Dietzia sp.]|uniref:3'(2'),5'-bisphosphate nucleotidase CysQ n=1 Tax=Dietzia sp. TaxID=1871616 RepID=UPI002FDA7CF1
MSTTNAASSDAGPQFSREEDQALAEQLAVEAGWLLLDVRESGEAQGRALGDLGDSRSDAFVLGRLAELRPGDAVLSEESPDISARSTAERVWIIDPVDGTREFSSPGRADWAVHVALWFRDGDPARANLDVSAVSLPALGTVIGTGGATSFAGESQPLAPAAGAGGGPGAPALLPQAGDDARPRILASGSRPPRFLPSAVRRMGGSLHALGSAGAKAMAVVRGEAEAYVHAGGQFQWDSAAPAGVALAHGLVACRIDGSPLEYNVADTYLPDLVICRPEIADDLLAAIAEARAK